MLRLYLAAEEDHVKFWIYTFHSQLPVSLPDTQKYLSCAIILFSHSDENVILSLYDVHDVCKDALDWHEEAFEQNKLTVLYTSPAFIWVCVDNNPRCNGFLLG